MKRLYLLRHAKSSWDDPSLPDFDRPLTKRGRQAAKAIGRYLAAENLRPHAALCSSARRTRDTWRHVSARWDDPPPVRHENGLYLAEPAAILKLLSALGSEADRVIVIGHNPGMEALATALTSNRRSPDFDRMRAKYPTGGLALFDLAIENWRDIAPGCGTLVRFVVPRDLD